MAAVSLVGRLPLSASTARTPPSDKNLFYIAFSNFDDEDHWVRARKDAPSIVFRHQYTRITLTLDEKHETVWIRTEDLELKFMHTAAEVRSVIQYFPHLLLQTLHCQAKKCTDTPVSVKEMKEMMQIASEKFKDPELKCYKKEAFRPLIAGQGIAYALFTKRTHSKDKVIGSGALKQVKLALGLNDARLIALGVCRRDFLEAPDWELIPNEIALLEKLRGIDGVVQLETAICCDNKFYILTQLYNQGNLQGLIDQNFPLSYNEKIGIARNLALGLSNIHALGILHRDLKPSNILVSVQRFGMEKRQVKAVIGDLGSGAMVNDPSFLERRTGTLAYLSPEKLSSFEDKGKTEQWVRTSTPQADIWSLGLILYSLFHPQTGTLMNFQTVKDIRLRMENLFRDEIQQELRESGIEPSLQVILMNMLHLDPTRRESALWVYKELSKKAPEKGGYYDLNLDVPLARF